MFMSLLNSTNARLLVQLWGHILPERRRQFFLLLLLAIVVSFVEILSIGATLPFLAVLTAPEQIFNDPRLHQTIIWLNIGTPNKLLMVLTILFCVTTLMAGGMRLALLRASIYLTYSTGADLGIDIYRRTLYQPYKTHINRNSSEVISGISIKANRVIDSIMMPSITIISSLIMLSFILTALILVDPLISVLAFSGFGFSYLIIVLTTRKNLLRNSRLISKESTEVIKSLQEGLGGIRDVLIDGNQEIYCAVYQKADVALRQAQGENLFITQCPRYLMEAFGMFLIAMLAYFLVQSPGGYSRVIPVLGTLALGAQRLLPVLQQIYSSWSSIQGGQASLIDALDLLRQPLPNFSNRELVKPIQFDHFVQLDNVSFAYGLDSPLILVNVSLKIQKGSCIGFIGKTGSGKSTLLDLLMGLLEPTKGDLKIDNQILTSNNCHAWQKHVAHVPQTIFLADTTIAENIAFGIPRDQIDYSLIRMVAEQAQISIAIEAMPNKYETTIGERGVRLSGGQRQRLGIARALYKRADVIIFDEATSALDVETEIAVMEAIEGLSENLTILIIAHRVSTLKSCSQIYELDHGQLNKI